MKSSMGLFRNFIHTFGSQILIILVGILNNIILVRTIGAKGQGMYALCLSTVTILVLLSSFGLSGANTYWTKRSHKDVQKIYSNSLIFVTVIAVVLISSYFLTNGMFLNYLLPQNLTFAILLTTLVLIILESNLGIIWGLDEIFRHNILILFKSCCIVLINAIILMIFKLNILAVLLGWCFVILITIVLSMHALKSYVRLFQLKANMAVFFNSIKVGIKSLLLSLIWLAFLKADLYLIRYFLSFSEVGYYSIAILILEASCLAPYSISRLMFNKAVLEDIKSVAQIAQVGRLNILYSTLICIGLLLFGKYFIVFSFGKDFISSFNCLLLLLPAIFARNINIICANYVSGREAISPFLIYTAIISLLLSVGLNIKLIPSMGIQGAAITASLVAVLQAAMSLFYFTHTTKISLSEFIILKKQDIMCLKNKLYFISK